MCFITGRHIFFLKRQYRREDLPVGKRIPQLLQHNFAISFRRFFAIIRASLGPEMNETAVGFHKDAAVAITQIVVI